MISTGYNLATICSQVIDYESSADSRLIALCLVK